MRKIVAACIAVLLCQTLRAQRDFTLEARGGFLGGGFRDEMFSPLNYAKTGFTVGLGGEYRFGKSQIGFDLNYNQATAKSHVSDFFTSDFYSGHIAADYLHALRQPSAKLNLWLGGGYRFALEGLIWEMDGYTYISSHSFAPIFKVDWNITAKHLISTRLSAYLFGFVSRPPYNYMPGYYDDTYHKSYVSYLMSELRDVKFAFAGQYWDLNWTASYHYRLSPRVMLGLRYGFRFQRYRRDPFVSQYDNTIACSVKIKL